MIQAIKGTKDLLPDSISQWQYLQDIFKEISDLYNYKELRTPIFESTDVFSRSIGENTDIVNKEMYTFLDKGGDSNTLRPENTASIVRSVIENSLLSQNPTLRVWYFGPFFRYERPQKGRLRQFHQYGAECIGTEFPESDVEIILLANHIIKSAGIREYNLFLNSLGNKASRIAYRETLTQYLNDHRSTLSEESSKRLEKNPLRVLDSKEKEDQPIIASAPNILDSLDSESSDHFNKVQKLLQESGIKYEIKPSLVRGLDYYSHTVFEVQHDSLGAQDSFGGGGRYNDLFEELGGKHTPAVGFALGVERMILILEETKNLPKSDEGIDIYIVNGDESYKDMSIRIENMLRQRKYKVVSDLQRRSFKAQFRESNKLGAKYTIIIGEDEYKNNTVQIKNMNTGEQHEYDMSVLNRMKFE